LPGAEQIEARELKRAELESFVALRRERGNKSETFSLLCLGQPFFYHFSYFAGGGVENLVGSDTNSCKFRIDGIFVVLVTARRFVNNYNKFLLKFA